MNGCDRPVRSIQLHEVVVSTMELCSAAARAGAPDGHVVVARRQTAGRGRTGRTWRSDDEGGLYLSVLFRGFPTVSVASGVTLAAGIAVHDAAVALGAADLDLKWPNDLLLGGRKVAGILTEWLDPGGGTPAVAIGIGLNVAQTRFPPDIEGIATSILLAGGRPVAIEAALEAVLIALDSAVASFRAGGLGWAVPEWSRRSRLWGRTVRAGGVEAVMLRLAPDGSLVVRAADGTERTVAGGLVELQPGAQASRPQARRRRATRRRAVRAGCSGRGWRCRRPGPCPRGRRA